jgi:hypothetical protein
VPGSNQDEIVARLQGMGAIITGEWAEEGWGILLI